MGQGEYPILLSRLRHLLMIFINVHQNILSSYCSGAGVAFHRAVSSVDILGWMMQWLDSFVVLTLTYVMWIACTLRYHYFNRKKARQLEA